MSSLIDTLKNRTSQIAIKTRDRGIDVLGKVRDGTLDWHRTLEARRAELDAANAPRWFQLGGLQIFVIDRFDHVLDAVSDKIREEIRRLQHLELQAAPATEAHQTATRPKAKAAAKRTAAKPKAKASAKKAAAKPKATAKMAAKAKSRPAAKRKATRRFVVPIAGYDELTAKEIIGEVPGLSPAQCATVRSHEASHKKRKTVLAALDARLAS